MGIITIHIFGQTFMSFNDPNRPASNFNNEASIEITLFHSAEGLDKIRHISLPYSVLSAYTYDILIPLPPTNIMPGSKPQIFLPKKKHRFPLRKRMNDSMIQSMIHV